MNYLEDYCYYNSGNECPRIYHVWGALSVAASVISRRVWLDMNYFHLHCNLYICLIGESGGRKTVARDIAYELLCEIAPDVPRAAEVMTREAISKFMAAPEQARFFDYDNKTIEYHPLTIMVTELKNFLYINPIGMIEFLTVIIDRPFFDVILKNKGTDVIPRPYLVFFASETPEWISDRLKETVIGGGFARRIIWVYAEEDRRIPFPVPPADSAVSWERVKASLRNLLSISGPFTFDPDAKAAYETWYVGLQLPQNRLLRGWIRGVHTNALRVAMLLALTNRGELVIRKDDFDCAVDLLTSLEADLERLTAGAGKNELAAPAEQLLVNIRNANGALSENRALGQLWQGLRNGSVDFYSVVQFLQRTGRLHVVEDRKGTVPRRILMTPEAFKNLSEAKP